MAVSSDSNTTAHLKQLYHAYRHTSDMDAKGNFFSPECKGICRPQPSYSAKSREAIVQQMHESTRVGPPIATASKYWPKDASNSKGYYTIRPLRDDELEFGGDNVVAPVGFATAEEVRQLALTEGWAGMRVDLWQDDGVDEVGNQLGLLVKVQYWWRKEEQDWVQILHDIKYVGKRDGTEGKEGTVLV